jgi:hypothetical protein
MNEFELLVRRFTATGDLDDAELSRLRSTATFAPVNEGLAEALGISGGSEIYVAGVIAEMRQHWRETERTIRAILDGTGRPSNVDDFLWKLSRQRGNPRVEIVEKVEGRDVVEVVTSWHVLADRLERKLRPPKAAARGGEIHEVNA